jgi:hypothetical protein
MRDFGRLVGGILLAAYLGRAADLELFHGPNGLMTVGAMHEVVPTLARYSLLELWPSLTGLWVLYGAALLSFAAMAAGAGRPAAIAALVLHVSFVHRNMTVVYGLDLVACFFLFFLALGGRGRGTLGSMGMRLAQVQVCIIYAFSGLQKLRGTAWWSGLGIWNSLANVEIARWDFSWMASFALPLSLVSFLVLAWEIYFPALVWLPAWRRPTLLAGVFLHLVIGILMSIPFFAAIMCASYVLFLSENEAEWLRQRFDIRSKRINSA